MCCRPWSYVTNNKTDRQSSRSSGTDADIDVIINHYGDAVCRCRWQPDQALLQRLRLLMNVMLAWTFRQFVWKRLVIDVFGLVYLFWPAYIEGQKVYNSGEVQWICIALSRTSSPFRYDTCFTRAHTVYLPPNTSHTCLYSTPADHHRPLAGTRCAHSRMDNQAELIVG